MGKPSILTMDKAIETLAKKTDKNLSISCLNSKNDYISFAIRHGNHIALDFSIYRNEGIYASAIAISSIEKMSDYELATRMNILVKLESQIKSFLSRYRRLIFTNICNKSIEICHPIGGVDVIDKIGRDNKIKRFELNNVYSYCYGKAVLNMESYCRYNSKLYAHAFVGENEDFMFLLSERSNFFGIRGVREKMEIVKEITKGIPLACNRFFDTFCVSEN